MVDCDERQLVRCVDCDERQHAIWCHDQGVCLVSGSLMDHGWPLHCRDARPRHDRGMKGDSVESKRYPATRPQESRRHVIIGHLYALAWGFGLTFGAALLYAART